MASADTEPDAVHDFTLKEVNAKLTVRYGDFAEPLSRVVKALTEVPTLVCVFWCPNNIIQARKYVANEHQGAMIEEYIASYVHAGTLAWGIQY